MWKSVTANYFSDSYERISLQSIMIEFTCFQYSVETRQTGEQNKTSITV